MDEHVEAWFLSQPAVQNSVVVHAALAMWRSGDCSLDYAVWFAMLALAMQNAELQKQVIEMAMRQHGFVIPQPATKE